MWKPRLHGNLASEEGMERVAQLPAECGDPEMFDMLANFHSVLGKKKKNHPLNIFPLNLRISLINTHTQKKDLK